MYNDYDRYFYEVLRELAELDDVNAELQLLADLLRECAQEEQIIE